MQQSSAEVRHDLFTIPNAITIGRLALSPIVAYRLAKQPAKHWPEAMLFAVADNVDGALARLGDRRPRLRRLGFRRSELGRKADPFVDKIFTAEMLSAGFAGHVLDSKPARVLATTSLIQKTTVGLQTWRNERDGIELHVSQSGKYFEFMSNVGFGLQFIAEAIAEPTRKRQVQRVGLGLATIGVTGALVNNVHYWLDAEGQRQGQRLLAEFEDGHGPLDNT